MRSHESNECDLSELYLALPMKRGVCAVFGAGKTAYDYRIRPKLHREGRPNLQNCTGTGNICASGLAKPGDRLQQDIFLGVIQMYLVGNQLVQRTLLLCELLQKQTNFLADEAGWRSECHAGSRSCLFGLGQQGQPP